MFASRSVLMAMMFLLAIAPTQCWIAPEIPHAKYTSGAMRVPVWPTWSVWLRQPLFVTATSNHDAPSLGGQLLQWLEAVCRTDAATTADDDQRGGERDARGARRGL